MAGQGGEAPRRGRVDRSRVRHVYQHELETAERLAALGEDVTFIPSDRDPRADAYLSDGRPYEFKSPTGSNRNTLLNKIENASARGKENFVLDLARSSMSSEDAHEMAQHAVGAYPGAQRIRIIGRETDDGPLDITVRKEGD